MPTGCISANAGIEMKSAGIRAHAEMATEKKVIKARQETATPNGVFRFAPFRTSSVHTFEDKALIVIDFVFF